MPLSAEDRLLAEKMRDALATGQTSLARMVTCFYVLLNQDEDPESPLHADITMAKIRMLADQVRGVLSVLDVALTTPEPRA